MSRKEGIMRHEEIEAIFTAKVAELIAAGYVINASTMSGSQGEIAKIDLKKGDEILRVMLEKKPFAEIDGMIGRGFDSVVLTVGRNTEPVNPKRFFDSFTTIWNNRLEVIEQRVFYRLNSDSDYFSEDLDEIRAQFDLHMARYRARKEAKNALDLNSVGPVVLPFVRRQPGCKTKKESDIDGVVKVKNGYEIFMKNGKRISLKSRVD